MAVHSFKAPFAFASVGALMAHVALLVGTAPAAPAGVDLTYGHTGALHGGSHEQEIHCFKIAEVRRQSRTVNPSYQFS